MVTIGILSPGDMGHGVGGQFRQRGARVVAYLEHRSSRTRALAAKAGIESLPSMDDLVVQADLLLSILVPAAAGAAADEVAESVARTGAELLYVDCNAIAPALSGRSPRP